MSLGGDTVDPDQFRTAMRRWATGVTVVTAQNAGQRHGMTVSSFTSISLEPPLVLISLEQGVKTNLMIQASGFFGVTILGEDQDFVSDRFAGRIPDIEDRFEDLEVITLQTGAPLLENSLAGFDCRVVSATDAGTHTIFLGEVIALRIGQESRPLVYFERAYHNCDS